jgi:hypothetical protein
MTGSLPFEPDPIPNVYAFRNYVDLSALTSDPWLVWRTGGHGLQRAALKSHRTDPDSNTLQIALELDMSKDNFRLLSNFEQGLEQKKLLEYGSAHRQERRQFGTQFTLHMPPKVRGERVQPLAAVDDDSASLPHGHALEIGAKITAYRKTSTTARRCYDGPSIYSWQV